MTNMFSTDPPTVAPVFPHARPSAQTSATANVSDDRGVSCVRRDRADEHGDGTERRERRDGDGARVVGAALVG